MNARQVFSIALKFCAIMLLIGWFEQLGQLILLYTSTAGRTTTFLSFQISPYTFLFKEIWIVLYIVFSYICWHFSDRISAKYIPESSKEIATGNQIILLAVAYQGISMVVSSIFNILSRSELIFAFIGGDFIRDSVMRPYTLQLVISMIELLLGVILVLHAHKISTFLYDKIIHRFWKQSIK